MPRRVTIAQASNRLSSLVHSVEDGPAVELTRRGKAVAVLLSKESYERLQPRKADFWEAVQRFRSETDLDDLDFDQALEGVRDPSPGRNVEL